jgi:carboxymethylenebutenolidase
MKRKTAEYFHPEVLKLFDQYVHGQASRRDFLTGAAKYAALAGVTASGLLAALSPQFAQAQQVKPDDSRLETRYVEIDSPDGNGKIRGYLVSPVKAKGKLPRILVVHENRGLNPHIEDITRWIILSPSRPTRFLHSAVIRAMKTRRGSYFSNSINRKPRKTLWQPHTI